MELWTQQKYAPGWKMTASTKQGTARYSRAPNSPGTVLVVVGWLVGGSVLLVLGACRDRIPQPIPPSKVYVCKDARRYAGTHAPFMLPKESERSS